MSEGDDSDRSIVRDARNVSVVIAATMILWILAQIVGGRLGLDPRLVFLFDMMALAGFSVALVYTWQIYKKRRGN